MKLNRIFKISILGAVLAAAAACNDAEYSAIDNMIYISEAVEADRSTQQILNKLIVGETQIALHVRMAQPASQDVHVKLALDPEFIEEYNRRNNTTYEMLPDDYLSFDNTAVITKGNISSDAVNIDVLPYPTGDNPYAVAVKIISSDSDVAITGKSSRLLYIFTKPALQKTPHMSRTQKPSGQYNERWSGNWGIHSENWTLEMWINMDVLGTKPGDKNNQAIFSNSRPEGSPDEIYIRWGDASIDGDKINGKFFGKGEIVSNLKFSTNTWYHIAFVAENGVVTLYVNGETDSDTNVNAIVDTAFDNVMFFGSDGYFVAQNAGLAQVRLWSRALSPAALKDGMMRDISPNSAGLEAYWKMNEGDGRVFHDSTPYGRHLECKADPSWSAEEVNFYNPNK